MENTELKAKVFFDKRNLRHHEEVLFTFKPDRRSYMRRNFIFGGGIPFPIVLIWAVFDFGFMLGVPIGMGEYWLWAIFIPFFAVHGAPIWIWIYGVVSGVKDYQVCGHMITNERIITRRTRKEPFTEFNVSEISSMTLLSNRQRAASIHIDATGKKPHTLFSLHLADAERAIDIYHDLKEREKHKEKNDRYHIFCSRCGGRTDNGYCMYCGSKAELREEYKAEKSKK